MAIGIMGITSCSSSTPSLEVIKSKYLLETNIRAALKNYKNEEVERIRVALRDNNVTELKIITNITGNYEYKTITSNFSTPSLGVTQAKVEVVVKLKPRAYEVSYKDSKGIYKEEVVHLQSPIIEKKVYECMYQFEGIYDFPLDWVQFN